ncbi:hypothetical protein CDL12_05854 [Handroanthus impetiginosus]|uniref:Uncharacterized protein n=1 Tax=Handroanthus impetiginosus TaxID=429701 RepID=A0A2G9HVS6_9LAMI|nr:hypothetical protein CDL12_05854 [Handroanthus impetiginosus]
MYRWKLVMEVGKDPNSVKPDLAGLPFGYYLIEGILQLADLPYVQSMKKQLFDSDDISWFRTHVNRY